MIYLLGKKIIKPESQSELNCLSGTEISWKKYNDSNAAGSFYMIIKNDHKSGCRTELLIQNNDSRDDQITTACEIYQYW